MTISDKLSWVGGMLGLFTGFSVISGVEILYWLFFVILCRKRNEIDPEKTEEICDVHRGIWDKFRKVRRPWES